MVYKVAEIKKWKGYKMRIEFEEISLSATRYWKENGKRRQETKKFSQTINPFNKNPDGSVKTRFQIQQELVNERADWWYEKVTAPTLSNK